MSYAISHAQEQALCKFTMHFKNLKTHDRPLGEAVVLQCFTIVSEQSSPRQHDAWIVPILKKLIGAFQKKYCSECKGKLQTVVASYTTDAVFKIPDGLDLEDKTVVQDWRTKYGKLYITYVNSDEVLTIDRDRVGYSD